MKKEIGIIGLGRMGMGMTERLLGKGYRVVGLDNHPDHTTKAQSLGAEVAASYHDLVDSLATERTIWLMVPSGAVTDLLQELKPLLTAGDTVIDGGNSFYQDSLNRYKELGSAGIHFLDCGVSGGVEGTRNGASLMVGGDLEIFTTHEDLFRDLAAPNGHARVGKAGAGHFVKMVHNGIEYGMMGAIAEGMNILEEHCEQFDLDLRGVLQAYEHESVIAGKLISWLAKAYGDGQIDRISGEVPKGETETEMEHITTIGEAKILEAALDQRRATRRKPSYSGKLLAAMRNQFGGHAVVKTGEGESLDD